MIASGNCTSLFAGRKLFRMNITRTHSRTSRTGQDQDRSAGGRRPRRAAAGTRRRHGTGDRQHAEPGRLRPRRRGGLSCRFCRESRPAAARGTWGCSATTRSNTASAAAFSKRSASTFRSARRTWPSAATSARSTPTARSPTAAPAGRPTRRTRRRSRTLRTIKIPGVELFVEPVKEHRFVLVVRGDGLGDRVNDTDPQAVGVAAAEGRSRPDRAVEEDGRGHQSSSSRKRAKVLASEGADQRR